MNNKMIIAIVQDKFMDTLIDRLLDENIHVTKLSSSGGFFKSGNSTLLLGCDEAEIPKIDAILKAVTKTEAVHNEKGEFHISGATVFIVDVEDTWRI